jgi:uncharacterized protein YhaN
VKIRRISIDGYGRFAGRTLDFAPGLQIIIGPNERGKSTIRAFIGDMLYGQKKAVAQRSYDETNELRTPWESPDCYGGTLVYELRDGRQIEVARNFDKKRESVQVFDRTNAREITGDFELLRNREVNFAQAHLGLTKEVFLSTATISHFSLEDLGDGDALNQIREKMLSLADTGEEHNSADATLRLLATRVQAIGQPTARTKPLPSAKARVAQLTLERGQAQALAEELAGTAERRRQVNEETLSLRRRRIALEEDLRVLEAHGRAARLREAESLSARIDTATQHCFALSAAREFPLERTAEVQRAEKQVETARVQLARTQSELEEVLRQLDAERARAGAEAARPLQEMPEELEARFNDLAAEGQRLRTRLAEAEAALIEETQAAAAAREALAEQQDFGRLGADPVEWITQLASSFGVALRSRDEERNALRDVNREIKQRRIDIAELHALFKEHPDFMEKARAHEQEKREAEDEMQRCTASIQQMETAMVETGDRTPGFIALAILCGAGMAGLLAAYFMKWNPAMLGAAGALALAAVYFGANASLARKRVREFADRIAEARARLAELGAADHGPSLVEELLARSGRQSVRELEAMYDRYREQSAELSARIGVLRAQETKTAEADQRVPRLLERLGETFERVGETITGEDDVKEAATRVIARYHAYRDAKRVADERQAAVQRRQREAREAQEALSENGKALQQTENDLRRVMREAGFDDERTHATAAAALRAFRGRLQRQRELRARVELLDDRAKALESGREKETAAVKQAEDGLAGVLGVAGVASAEQWHIMAAQAREYREVWEKRAALEDQLAVVLRDQDLRELREAVSADGELPPPPKRNAAQIKSELDGTASEIDDKMKEEHALHIAMTQRGANMRSLNEIEEDLAAASIQAQELELELEATSYAMALIEEIARDKHARIAPKLANRASHYFERITSGAYSEVLISRDLTISVRIPQTNRMNEAPEKSLSKGTVDQLYLALRLALVQSVSEIGEPAPMLLDDPFANYDDGRLARTMNLISEIAETNQVLLFTCREDVARAAEAVNAPIIRL